MLDELVKGCLDIVLDGKHGKDAQKTPWIWRILLGAAVIAAMLAVCGGLVWVGDHYHSPIMYILAAGIFLAFSSYGARKIFKYLKEFRDKR